MAQQFSNEQKIFVMDTKLIKTFGEEILSYRLRSARQKKRMQYEDFDKQLIQIHKREAELCYLKRNLGWEPLTPPVQKGWKRFFVLKDDVARGKQAEFFQGILDKINTYDWSYRKDFMVKRRRFGRKKYVVKGQCLLEPDEQHFKKLGFTEFEQQLFRVEYRTEKWSMQPVKRFVFAEPWRFVLRVRPNIIDKIRKKDAELESQIMQLRNHIDRKDLRKRMIKALGSPYNHRWWKQKETEKHTEVNVYENKSLRQILDIIKQE